MLPKQKGGKKGVQKEWSSAVHKVDSESLFLNVLGETLVWLTSRPMLTCMNVSYPGTRELKKEGKLGAQGLFCFLEMITSRY